MMYIISDVITVLKSMGQAGTPSRKLTRKLENFFDICTRQLIPIILNNNTVWFRIKFYYRANILRRKNTLNDIKRNCEH